MKLSSRLKKVRGEGAFDVLVKARALEAQGRSIIHMEIGEPDFPTPPNIVAAGKRALDEGWTKYGPTQGDPELRQAIAEHISETRGISVGPDRVVVTPGAKPILFFSMLALLEPGDEVLYPNPGFPIYESTIHYTGATPVAMPLVEERGFSLDLDQFRRNLSDRTKMIILCSPQNPTGGTIPEQGRMLGPVRLDSGCALLWASARRPSPSWEEMSERVHEELRRRLLESEMPRESVELLAPDE